MTSCSKKLLSCIFIAGSLVACGAWAFPCEKYHTSQSAMMPDEVETNDEPTTCAVAEGELIYSPEQSEVSWRHDIDNNKSFWDDWMGYSDSPVLSSRSEKTFYGLGIWIPAKYEDTDILSFEDMQEWIKSHGLQMSLGIGGDDNGSPRLRVDYRWHDDNLDDVFIQVEIPF